MRKYIIIIVLLFSALNSFAQNDKEDAKVFFKKVVQSYFDSCSFFIESMADSIIPIGIQDNYYYPKSEISFNRICDRISKVKKRFKVFLDYDNNYHITVYNKSEFISKSKDVILKDSNIIKNERVGFTFLLLNLYNKMYSDNDFFVVGNYPKNENTNKILDGVFWFIIRKTTTKGWKIIALHQ
ncbi:MAG: hypothetical protein ACOVO1_01230 [Chitinophagaceae bacterium]